MIVKSQHKITELVTTPADGQPTSGVTNPTKIKQNIKEANKINDDDVIPIFGLAFGAGADFELIKDISTESNAFARKIFEGSDATFQLEDFYSEISSPQLRNIKFSYVGDDELETVENVLPQATFYNGSEIVSVVKLGEDKELTSLNVDAYSYNTPYNKVIKACPGIWSLSIFYQLTTLQVHPRIK